MDSGSKSQTELKITTQLNRKVRTWPWVLYPQAFCYLCCSFSHLNSLPRGRATLIWRQENVNIPFVLTFLFVKDKFLIPKCHLFVYFHAQRGTKTKGKKDKTLASYKEKANNIFSKVTINHLDTLIHDHQLLWGAFRNRGLHSALNILKFYVQMSQKSSFS